MNNRLGNFAFIHLVAVTLLIGITVAALDPVFRRNLASGSFSGGKEPRQGSSSHLGLLNMNELGTGGLRDSRMLNFVNADGSSAEAIIGVDYTKPEALEILGEALNGEQGQIVNSILVDGKIIALVADIPSDSVSWLLDEIQHNRLVRYVEPNWKFHDCFVPNDAFWIQQWGPGKIEADFAWNTTTGSSSVLVAIIDTGVDYDHPDLTANYVPKGLDWVNNDTDPMDDNGHGTHCAGIIGAVLNNSMGISGLAQVSIMAEKALDSSGEGYADDLAQAIIHAVNQGARILSNSWGDTFDSQVIHDAVKYAQSRDVLVVAAAGNDASRVKNYPAAYDEVVSVTATDRYDNPADFTNYGDWIELAAPGSSIYSTVWDNSYGMKSGTSMACPHVAGLAALIWSQFPDVSRDWVRARLRATADDLEPSGFDIYYGYGRINARRAIEQVIPDHDLLIFSYQKPKYIRIGDSASFNITVLNGGANDEEDVVVRLLVNGGTADTTLISYMIKGASEKVSLLWCPLAAATYNVTIYAEPVGGENITANNALSEPIRVVSIVGNVAFEEAHLPLYTVGVNPAADISGGYSEFADYLAANGYDISVVNPGTLLHPDLLSMIDVLVIAAPQARYADSEVDAIVNWVKNGGRLLLITDCQVFTFKARTIASRFDINLAGCKMGDADENLGIPYWVYYDGANICPHAMTANVTRVEMYAGDAIGPAPSDKIPLIVSDSDGTEFATGGAMWPQASGAPLVAAFDGGTAGLGKMAVVCDSNMWDNAYDFDADGDVNLYDSDNEVLALNIVNWLSARRQHELVVRADAPNYLRLNQTTLLNATVYNKGLSNESNVRLQLLIDNATVWEEVFTLASGGHHTFEYLWDSSLETTCNVTVYAPPLSGESITTNNICSRTIRVRNVPRILAYVQYADYGQEFDKTLAAINSTFGSDYTLTELWNYTLLGPALQDRDVLLIPEQENADAGTMAMIAAAWSQLVYGFVQDGGVLVVCDYRGGTYRIVESAGLISVLAVLDQTNNTLYLGDSADQLAQGISTSFPGPNGTLGFGADEARILVGNGIHSVVIHKKLVQGHVVLLGFDFYASNSNTEKLLGNAMALSEGTPEPEAARGGMGSSRRDIK